MTRLTFSLMVASFLSANCGAAETGGPNLDIAGIKIGMGIKDAMAALKADNPQLQIIVGTHELQGFDKPVHPNVTAQQSPGGGNDGENIELLFTMPPNHALVWGISRINNFAEKNRPSLENTIAALRSKYGPESIPPDPDPRNHNKTLVWVFDAQGKFLPNEHAMALYRTCAAKLQSHFGNSDLPSFNDIQAGTTPSNPCDFTAIITADVQAAAITPGSQQLVVFNLIVRMNDGRLYGKAIEKTRAVATGSAKAQENKAVDEINKRGAPKL
jgi:hypothetical protein